MRPTRVRGCRLVGAVVVVLLAFATGAAAQPATPDQKAAPAYLSYAEFSPEDTAAKVVLKRAYNEAVQRYNQALYGYHVTLEKHDRVVDVHNQATDPAERKKAREEAEALRARLAALRREVTSRAAAVDEAWRRAAAGGVTITR